MKDRLSYSKAFKLHVMEELRDGRWKTQSDAAVAYGLPQSYIHSGCASSASNTSKEGPST